MKRTVVTKANLTALIKKIEAASVMGFDTESIGPSLTSEKMINVYRSRMLGLSVAFEDGTSYYAPVAHRDGNLSIRDFESLVRSIAGKVGGAVWAHNWKHDSLVLQQEFGWRPNPAWLCSMVLCWLAGEDAAGRYGLKALAKAKLGQESKSFEETFKDKSMESCSPDEVCEYACKDAEWSLALGMKFYPKLTDWDLVKHFHEVEMPFVYVLRDMEWAGMAIDQAGIAVLEATLKAAADKAAEEWDFILPDVSITSGKQIAERMFDGGHWPTKKALKTKGGGYATTREVMEKMLEECPPGTLGHEAARLKLEYQAAAKYLSTYTHTLVEAAENYPDGRLHPSFHHTGTATGRLSCSSPNLQNIPARTEMGRAIKACFVPAPGNVFVAADYSQIEPRVLAHYIGNTFAEVYRNKQDIYKTSGATVGCTRDQAKTLVLAMMYGVGPNKVARNLKVTYKQAMELIKGFKEKFPEIETFRQRAIEAASERGYIKTLAGRRRCIPELSTHSEDRWRGERLAMNTPIQGTAADVMKLAMLAVHGKLPDYDGLVKMVGQVHDELTLECPANLATDVSNMLANAMEAAMVLKVPLVAEAKVGQTWAGCK